MHGTVPELKLKPFRTRMRFWGVEPEGFEWDHLLPLLTKMRNLLDHPSRWCQGAKQVPLNERCFAYSLLGAAKSCGPSGSMKRFGEAFIIRFGGEGVYRAVTVWNDSPQRQHTEVLELLDQMINERMAILVPLVEQIRSLLTHREGWCQNEYEFENPRSPTGHSFCLVGAAMYVGGKRAFEDGFKYMFGSYPLGWNDQKNRQHREVLRRLDTMIRVGVSRRPE